MAPSRAYIPSAALIRALARPQPLRCPFARPLPAQFVRGKKSKAAKAREAEKAQMAQQARKNRHIRQSEEEAAAEAEKEAEEQMKKNLKNKKIATATGPLRKIIDMFNSDKESDKLARPPSNEVFKDGEDPGIDFYEMDLDKGTQRKVDRFGTVADRKRERETFEMIEESYKDPNYDDAELNKRLMDGLMSNPAFADLTEELKEIKESISTKEELKAIDEQAEKDAQPQINQMNATLRMAIHEALTELINDPDVGNAKGDLQAVLDKMPEMEDIENPEFQAVLDKALEKVNKNEKLQKKLKAGSEEESVDDKKEWADFEDSVDDLLKPEEEWLDENGMPTQGMPHPEEINELMRQMRDVMKSLGGNGDLEAELDKMLKDDPLTAEEEEDENGMNFDREMDPEELANELTKLAKSKATSAPQPDPESEEEEHVPPELQAKVDKIMEDPRLVEKLMYIQKLIAEHSPPAPDPNDLTQYVPSDVAPDPYELESSRTATIAQRMTQARADPEHRAALQRLRVRLQPPFNISPALKSFNQAIEFAYIGANDDVRRILWRSYQKARSLPTFLQNVSDEAWDILYYSQAVTWSGNQNRTAHLKMLLRDLESLGRQGPPTHPATLVEQGGQGLQT